MMQTEPVDWGSGAPHSQRFNDIYRTRYGALAQAQAVFLAGCGLPGRWHDQTSFTILETGFGLGLNFLATWGAWSADPRRCRQLNYIAIEAYPVLADDILHSAQALATEATPPAPLLQRIQKSGDTLQSFSRETPPDPLPQRIQTSGDTSRGFPRETPHDPLVQRIQTLTPQLATCWAGLQRGPNHWHLPLAPLDGTGQVDLHLYVGDVQAMLPLIDSNADAVYLDGFSPAVNPDMWSKQTLTLVAQHCHPGTHLASYTVAGAVRRRLSALGFAVHKCPGLPPKRERLQAVL